MGSTGSWEASVSLLRKVNLKQKEENSIKDIQKFISKNESLLIQYKKLDDINESDILLSIELRDDDGEEYNTFQISDKDVNAKEFLDSGKHWEMEDLEEYKDNEYFQPKYWGFGVKTDSTKIEDKLKFVNLKKLKDYVYNWNSDSPYIVSDSESLADCNDYIYCHNDNSASASFRITQKFIDSLNVGDEILLEGNGDGEHC